MGEEDNSISMGQSMNIEKAYTFFMVPFYYNDNDWEIIHQKKLNKWIPISEELYKENILYPYIMDLFNQQNPSQKTRLEIFEFNSEDKGVGSLLFVERILGKKQIALIGKNEEEKSKALVYCSKASDSFLQAKKHIGDDLIWNAFVCFNLSRAEYYKQLLNESFGVTSSNEWEAYINESIRSWMTSNKIIAEHFVSKKLENKTFFQQALISQENKVRVSKVVLQMMKRLPLTDYNGNPWVKQYNDITKTSFFKNLPKEDPQKQTDSLVEDIRELIKNNNN